MTPALNRTALADDSIASPGDDATLAATIDEVTPLFSRLNALREEPGDGLLDTTTLDGVYTRSLDIVGALRPSLATLSLPVPRRYRQAVRRLLDMLRVLAEETFAASTVAPAQNQSAAECTALWRCMRALSLHLLLSSLAAAPAAIGIWLQLHRAYARARQMGIELWRPEGAPSSIQGIYASAVLLGCAQPASFTSREIDFAATYLDRFAERLAFVQDDAAKQEATARFWIDPNSDAPAIPYARKPPPPDTPILCFACDALVARIKQHLDALARGLAPRALALPEFATTAAGQGVLHRLIGYFGHPGKRRFPRRRQHYRAELCAGLSHLWQLFQPEALPPTDTSSWMVTNESPDGCAIMHVIGRTGNMSVGDVVALRAESGSNWQIAIIRWAQSENPEHLEFGLQILAAKAVPARLVRRSGNAAAEQEEPKRVLLLQTPPAFTPSEMLIAPSGFINNHATQLVLVVEQSNIEIREIDIWQVEEQNSHIEVLSIARPDALA